MADETSSSSSSGSSYVDVSVAYVDAPIEVIDYLVVFPVIGPLIMGALCLMLRRSQHLQPGLAGITLAAVFAGNVALAARVMADGPVFMAMSRWHPPFGISFNADALGVFLALSASLVALVCTIYSARSVDSDGRRYGFYPFLLFLTAGVSGAFLTGDIFNLYVWFEVLLISSFGLIILGNAHAQLDGAVKYAFLNLIATTLFLIAVGYTYGLFGTLNMADLTIQIAQTPDAPIGTISFLFVFAFAMKAAAFPLNFWLPASYHTPNIVSSALFAALLTKVGVYALIRVGGMLFAGSFVTFETVLVWVAASTAVLGAVGALGSSDIRKLLGFLVLSGIGAMFVGIAVSTPVGIAGAVLYAVHSIVVMAALYLAAGVIGRMTGSFQLHDVAGLYRASPLFAALFLILVFAVSGLPPFSGFWPKVLLVRATLEAGEGWLTFAYLLSSFIAMIAIGRVWLFAFWRDARKGGSSSGAVMALDEGERRAYISPILLLVIVVVGLGLVANPALELAGQTAVGIIDPTAYITAVSPVLP
ncbi:MAG: Na+/H+ antiporter subunit D [Devosiaceae bacterium]|nr:Na+/H+ antiporter subunit D [Devosiaceae bacterium MH13]